MSDGPRITVTLELENDEEGNTWWSNGHPEENSIQVHVDRPVYVALGSPQRLHVTMEKADPPSPEPMRLIRCRHRHMGMPCRRHEGHAGEHVAWTGDTVYNWCGP